MLNLGEIPSLSLDIGYFKIENIYKIIEILGNPLSGKTLTCKRILQAFLSKQEKGTKVLYIHNGNYDTNEIDPPYRDRILDLMILSLKKLVLTMVDFL
jgi:Cdc6-like AAA superfamily ATPase